MNKSLMLLFLLVIGAISAFTQTLGSISTAKIDEIKERGYLVVGMTAVDQFPFYYENSDGTMAGLDVDIAKEVANRIGVDLRISRAAQGFNDLIPLVLNREIDFASSKLSLTLARSRRVLYTDPYIVFSQALLINKVKLAKFGVKDNELKSFLKSFEENIGVIKNSSYERYANLNFPHAKIDSLNSWEDVIDAGINGEVFAIYRDELEIFKIMQSQPSSNLTLKPVILEDQIDPIAIAVHPSEFHFVFYLNRVLESMNIEQDTRRLLDEYKFRDFVKNKQ